MNLYRVQPLARFVGWIADKINGPTCGVPGAVTIGGMILYLSEQPPAIHRHEWVHVLQAARYCPRWLRWLSTRAQAWAGFPRFLVAYWRAHDKSGYKANYFEVEAEMAEDE